MYLRSELWQTSREMILVRLSLAFIGVERGRQRHLRIVVNFLLKTFSERRSPLAAPQII